MHRIKIICTMFLVFLMCLATSPAYAANKIETLVRVAFDRNLPPYQFLDEGEPKGIHIDLMDSIARENNYRVEYYPFDSQSGCITAFEDGEVDIILGVTPRLSKEYQVQSSSAFSEATACALTQKSRADAIRNTFGSKIYTLSYQFGTMEYEYMTQILAVQGVLASNQFDALDKLINGEADIMIGNKDTIRYQLNQLGLSDEYTIISNFATPITYDAIVRSYDIRQIINSSLQRMQYTGEYETILNSWGLGMDYQFQIVLRRVITIALIVAVAFLSVEFFRFRWNVLLKREVSEKTLELQRQVVQTRRSNELCNKIFENSPFGIVVFDPEFLISLINSSACQLLGLAEGPIGQHGSDIRLLDQMLCDKYQSIIQNGESFLNQEIRCKSERGSETIYRYDIDQLYAQDYGRGTILFFRDTTIENHMKEQIYEREKSLTLNRIIAGIAHEVRNPLGAIKNLIELLPQAQNDTELNQQIVTLVPKEVERINQLLSGLTDYARPNQGNKEVFEVEPAVRICVDLVHYMIEKEHIHIDMEMEPGLVIRANRNQFRQVLLNIIINSFEAIQALPQPRAEDRNFISVSTSHDEAYVHLQIVDRGIGMNETELRRATEPFFTQKATGTGLGLYLSKQYVEENQGTLEITSVPNEYTNVHIAFRRLQ